MEPISTSTSIQPPFETIGDSLDRVEIIAGKIGMIPTEQAFELLRGMDSVYTRMQGMEPGNPSLKIYQAQFDAISGKIRKEANRFLRDLGGAQALRQAREELKPPEDHWWWYLDDWLAANRRASVKRWLIIAGLVLAGIAIFGAVYNRFLAPDPNETARYSLEQNARDLMMKGDLQGALDQVNQGLQIPPADPTLLVLKGVILDSMGQADQAEQTFKQARTAVNNTEGFYLERGQDYVQAGKVLKALADAQAAIQANPNSGSAYLLLGQVNEMQQKYQDAMDAYNKAYEVADKTNQTEIAALSRMRLAMLMQSMNSQMPGAQQVTPTP
jgi:tetratricopeptide (TPR) repeat protein